MATPTCPTPHSYVPDVAAGLATLGTDERAVGGVWHLPGPETATTRQVLELIAGEVGHPVGVRSVPKLVMRALGLFNPMMRELAEMAYEFEEPFVLDTSRYESTFGAAGTPLAHAIAATVAWYRTQTATPDTPTQEGPTSWPAPTRASPPPQTPLATSPREDAGARFRPISNPATGEWIQFIAIPEDSDEDIVRFNWRSMPGGAITEHTHPHQEERFTIMAGEAHFTVDGEERVVGPGETIVVPVGVRHSEANPGSVEIRGVVELRPALHSREMHEAFAGLAADGRTTPRGAPRNPLQLGSTLWHFRRESRVTSPPIWVQNLILPPLWALAKLFGVRPSEDHWDTRISEVA